MFAMRFVIGIEYYLVQINEVAMLRCAFAVSDCLAMTIAIWHILYGLVWFGNQLNSAVTSMSRNADQCQAKEQKHEQSNLHTHKRDSWPQNRASTHATNL